MKVKIYTIDRKELIGIYNVKSVYDPVFYFCNMPTLSAKRCRGILNMVSPNFKISYELFAFENVDTGHSGIQKLYRNGTILNF